MLDPKAIAENDLKTESLSSIEATGYGIPGDEGSAEYCRNNATMLAHVDDDIYYDTDADTVTVAAEQHVLRSMLSSAAHNAAGIMMLLAVDDELRDMVFSRLQAKSAPAAPATAAANLTHTSALVDMIMEHLAASFSLGQESVHADDTLSNGESLQTALANVTEALERQADPEIHDEDLAAIEALSLTFAGGFDMAHAEDYIGDIGAGLDITLAVTAERHKARRLAANADHETDPR